MMIRAEQMKTFETTAEDNFVRRIAAHLLEHYAKAVVRLPETESPVDELPEEKLHSLIKVSIERARSYGMTLESSIPAFTALMFEVAPNFDSHRLIKMLLNDETYEPNERVNELTGILTEKNWETIRSEYDVNAWESKLPEPENTEETGKTADALESDFAKTVMNIEPPPKNPEIPSAAPKLDFDQTVMNIGVTKKPAKEENFDFLDTVINVNVNKE